MFAEKPCDRAANMSSPREIAAVQNAVKSASDLKTFTVTAASPASAQSVLNQIKIFLQKNPNSTIVALSH